MAEERCADPLCLYRQLHRTCLNLVFFLLQLYPFIMSLQLHIPPCIHQPARPNHFPQPRQPIRIQIEGPLVSIEKLLPTIEWQTNIKHQEFPQPAGPALARLTFAALYGTVPHEDEVVVRDEYLGWVVEDLRYIYS